MVFSLVSFSFFISSFVFLTVSAYAAVSFRITEIMYNPEGTDAKREWVEIINTGDSIDITELRFREGDVNHKLKVIKGKTNAESGDIFVIADNPDTFSIDYPSFNGNLLDSSFSLKNTGEALEIKKDDEILHSVTYSKDDGGNGDGNSLHVDVNGDRDADVPSPGEVGMTDGLVQSSTSSVSSVKIIKEDSTAGYRIDSSSNPILLGIETTFTLTEMFESGKKRKKRGIWNLGDGTTRKGLYIFHIYLNVGEYIISVKPSSGDEDTYVTARVRVMEPLLSIERLNDQFISLRNDHDFDFDVSNWKIISNANEFIFPDFSFVRADTTTQIRFENKINENIRLVTKNNYYIPIKTKEIAPKPNKIVTVKETKKEIIKEKKPEEKKKIVQVEEANKETIKKIIDFKDNRDDLILWLFMLIGIILIAISPLFISSFNKK